MLNTIEDELKGFYEKNMASHGTGAQGVGWKNEEAQLVRFQQLEKVLPAAGNFSINDLGCGTAAFVEYLSRRFTSFTYHGYDVLKEMIDICKKKYQGTHHSFAQIQDASEMAEADYTVASGIFNIRYSVTDDVWKKYILDSLAQMNLKSKNGFAFNALTAYSDPEFMKRELYYSDPLFLFDHCKKNFSKNVALLHDYYQYDFTIIVRKV